MKPMIFLLTLCLFLILGVPSLAQSTGGGGGGDRVTKIWKSDSPPQFDVLNVSCEQLQSALQVFGKLRINRPSFSGVSVFEIVATYSLLTCNDTRNIKDYYTRTQNKASCRVGYICRPSGFGR